jgi:hypothetical protein
MGEDVDLVWRLGDAGWSVRYVPAVEVGHHEPGSWSAWLSRRFRYGTSAAPLAQRHPDRLAPLELRPWPAAAALTLLAGRPRVALGAVGVSAAVLARRVVGRHVPPWLPFRWSAEAAGWTLVGIGHAATMLAAPALAVAGARNRRSAGVVLALALAPPLVAWWRCRPDLDPARWSLASLADDVAYGAGVWSGCLRSGSVRPLLPALRLQQSAERGDAGVN